MPAKTTEQLFATHSQYLDASNATPNDFRNALNEIMPRIYKLGFWREMLLEHSQDASDGYVSLPQNTDAIIHGILDNNPVSTRSLWHDYKMVGTNDQDKTTLTAFIDDGYAPVYRDLEADSNYQIFVATLKEPFNKLPDRGKVTVKYRQYADATDAPNALIPPDTILKGASFNEATLDFSALTGGPYAETNIDADADVTEIISITWDNVETDHPFIVKAKYKGISGGAQGNYSTKDLLLAEINSKRGSSRYRRFRIGGTNASSSAHMLLKRKWVEVDSSSDLVHMPSNAILKHALLGKLGEDNADLERAQYHWANVASLLESDTDSYRGAAKPTLRIAPDGVGAGMHGMY